MKMEAAQVYAITHDRLVNKLCSGRLLHIDETSISVRGVNGYVWVLTSMEEVAYFFTPTRESDTIKKLLKNFSGVLVSDFYTAYDAIDCPQQKCLIHFIRDLNNAILKHPYDEVLKQLAGNFAGVMKPIIETVDRRGLKKRFLGKFRNSIDRFYKGIVDDDASDAAGRLVDRLQKNRNKMFTFLDFDRRPAVHLDNELARLAQRLDQLGALRFDDLAGQALQAPARRGQQHHECAVLIPFENARPDPDPRARKIETIKHGDVEHRHTFQRVTGPATYHILPRRAV